MNAGLALGLAAWAAVLWMRMNPTLDTARLQAPAAGTSVPPAPRRSGSQLYAAECSSCHQNRGEGRFPVFPPLAGSSRANGDPYRLAAITLHGLSGPIEANGVRYSGLMPGLAHLNDEEIATVLNHVRSSWGNAAAPLQAADVAAVRGLTSRRHAPWTAAELDALGVAAQVQP
ncbi:MAG: hypothetical protein ABS45_16045 [Comamonas sp. SCN 65-56]|nr:cytochrome c [Comamonas sp. SCN 65-56]ODS90386.1 MAG: hypothetical protein ABS45_16045 [Comamonas sp. SCN 65-56]